GYGNAQEYLRLMDELPLYSHVVAVVTLVLPEQISRDNFLVEPHLVIGDDGKPRLGPPRTDLRLARLVRGEPYRGDDAVEFTRDLLRAQAAEVAARGARQLFLFINMGGACHDDDGLPRPWIVDELLEKAGLPYRAFAIGGDEQLSAADPHPNEAV